MRQSGTASISIGGAPQLDHAGPLGCAGRYFTAHLTEHIRIFFRCTAHEAWMLVGTGQLYHFGERPKRRQGTLLWDRTFPDRHSGLLLQEQRAPRLLLGGPAQVNARLT